MFASTFSFCEICYKMFIDQGMERTNSWIKRRINRGMMVFKSLSISLLHRHVLSVAVKSVKINIQSLKNKS